MVQIVQGTQGERDSASLSSGPMERVNHLMSLKWFMFGLLS